MQAERPVLTCSPSFSSTCSESKSSTPRQKWTTTHHQKSATETPNDNYSNSNSSSSVFDFSFDCGADFLCSPISADQIFHNGKIRPTLPLPNQFIFLEEAEIKTDPKLRKEATTTSRRKALRRLFVEDREPASLLSSSAGSTSSSSTSSEVDEREEAAVKELDSVPEGTYCAWKPKSSVVEASGSARIKKGEGSSGSMSRRWKLMDLLTRNSSGAGAGDKDKDKDNSSSSKRHEDDKGKETVNVKKSGRQVGMSGRKSAELPPPATTKKEGGDGGEKKRISYLPYRQELVGIFGNSNGSRNQQR